MLTKRLMCLLTAALLPLVASSDEPVPNDCVASSVGLLIPISLPRPMVAEGRVVAARARDLGVAYRVVESVLRYAGYEPDEFSVDGRSWAAVVRGEDALVAVYERDQGRLVRVNAFGTEVPESFILLIDDVEQSLAHTPDDCGTAFGAIDAGIESADGDQLIYSLRLGDGQQHVWGMHYRFHRRGGELVHVERLHVVCEVDPTILTQEMLELLPAGVRREVNLNEFPAHPRFVGGTNMPGHDMPTEAQLLQLHLVPDYHYGIVQFRVRDGIITVERDELTIRNRWTRIANGCDVVEYSQPRIPDDPQR